MRVRMLSFHVPYRCQDSGACCTAGWPIPIDGTRMHAAGRAIADGRLRLAAGAPAAFLPFRDTDGGIVATTAQACVFYRGKGARRCSWQRALGHDALPLACRRFPRVSIVDPRGVSTTLSHYCPTAGALLRAGGPTAIVDIDEGPSASEADPADVGLDMRDSVPPLLCATMFSSWQAWSLFEARAIDAIDRAVNVGVALATLRSAVEHVRTWSPRDGALEARVESAFHAPSPLERPGALPVEHLRTVLDAVPDEWRPPMTTLNGREAETDEALRLLAAHAFASWTAQLGHGLRTWLRSLEAVAGLLAAGLGVREADLLLRHLADPVHLARAWSAAEHEGP